MELFSKEILKKTYSSRNGETRLGDTIQTAEGDYQKAIQQHVGKFVIVGIPEDIGPVANLGQQGAVKTYRAFLKNFLKVQDNRFLKGEDILVLGEIDCFDLVKQAHKLNPAIEAELTELQNLVAQLDDLVIPVIQAIIEANKIPIVIGGGHNNAYGLLKGSSLGLQQPLQCINIDPHADLRTLEGRHSGNGFSKAIQDQALEKYFVAGLHESYNNEYILNQFEKNKNLDYLSYDEINQNDWKNEEVIQYIFKHISPEKPTGLELDLDSLPLVPSSALTPAGISVDTALNWVWKLATSGNIVYFNISEGIPSEHYPTGKLISYLVAQFIKAVNSK